MGLLTEIGHVEIRMPTGLPRQFIGTDSAKVVLAKIREVVEGAELTDGEIERSRTFGLHGESMPAIHVEAIARVMKWTILKAMEEVE